MLELRRPVSSVEHAAMAKAVRSGGFPAGKAQ
jgi:hypothetical protein